MVWLRRPAECYPCNRSSLLPMFPVAPRPDRWCGYDDQLSVTHVTGLVRYRCFRLHPPIPSSLSPIPYPLSPNRCVSVEPASCAWPGSARSRPIARGSPPTARTSFRCWPAATTSTRTSKRRQRGLRPVRPGGVRRQPATSAPTRVASGFSARMTFPGAGWLGPTTWSSTSSATTSVTTTCGPTWSAMPASSCCTTRNCTRPGRRV